MHAAERAPQREIDCVDSLPAEDMCGSCDFYRHRISSALPDRLDRLPNPRTGPPCAADMHLLSPSCRMTRNPIPLSFRSYRAFLATNNPRLLLSPLFEHSTPPLVYRRSYLVALDCSKHASTGLGNP